MTDRGPELQVVEQYLAHPFLLLAYGRGHLKGFGAMKPRVYVEMVMCCVCEYRGNRSDFQPGGRFVPPPGKGITKFNAHCPQCFARPEINLGRSIWNLLMAGGS